METLITVDKRLDEFEQFYEEAESYFKKLDSDTFDFKKYLNESDLRDFERKEDALENHIMKLRRDLHKEYSKIASDKISRETLVKEIKETLESYFPESIESISDRISFNLEERKPVEFHTHPSIQALQSCESCNPKKYDVDLACLENKVLQTVLSVLKSKNTKHDRVSLRSIK